MIDGDDGLAAVHRNEGGFFRSEVHQRTHRATGAAEGIVFQRIGKGEEPEEDGAFFPVADHGRADGGQHHQQVDTDLALHQEFERVDGGKGAPKEIGEDEQSRAEKQLDEQMTKIKADVESHAKAKETEIMTV